MPRPKPAEPLHRFILRMPYSLWKKLVQMAYDENRSINKQVCELVENARKERAD